MVLITIPRVAILLAAIFLPANVVVAQDSYSVDTLTLRGLSLDDDLDLAARGYDDEGLSIREYIDSQIELAIRDYEDEIQELFARHTQAEIDKQIAYFKRKLAESKPLLKPAVEARRAAEKAYKAKPKDAALKEAYRKAKNHEDGVRGMVEQNQEALDYWQSQRPSRSPSPSTKGKKGKK